LVTRRWPMNTRRLGRLSERRVSGRRRHFTNHESPKTTRRHDHTSNQLTLDEVDRIVI
jgi:hypothetical protein